MKQSIGFLLAFFSSFSVLAQASFPDTYYWGVQGLRGEALKTALHDLSQPSLVLGYGGKGEGYTWAGFAAVDALPGGLVRDRYSNVERHFNGLLAIDGMNIEHIWANSWWGHTVNNAYCDLFNLYPSDGQANGRKSNNPIGKVDGTVAYDNGVIRVGKSTSYRADSLITAWEPADTWKGDFARTYFYMATTYSHMRSEWQTTEGLLTVDPASWQTMRPWVSELMMQWAEADPVDDIERERNEGIFRIQGNRNPYVDFPQLAQHLWGDATATCFYINPETTEPELFVPASNLLIDFGLQALSLHPSKSIMVRGRNLPEGLEVRLEGNGFTMSSHQLTASQVEQGVRLPVELTATSGGDYTATLFLTDGHGFEQRATLAMIVIDGIPAYEGRSISCNVNSKAFTATWMDMHLEADETYMLQVYQKDGNGERKMLNSFPRQLSDTSCVVNGLQPLTTYFYQVSARDGALVSNEVQVDMPAVTPVFSVTPSQMAFSALPGEASAPQQVKVTALEVPQFVTSVICPAPFEVSEDGESWSEELTLKGARPQFLVRLTALPDAGEYEGEMTVSTPGVNDVIVTLTASVDASKGFFETFEQGSKSGYAAAEVACNAASWMLDNVLLAADANSNGSKSARMKIGGSMTMTTDHQGGCDSLWFYAGLYNKDTGVRLNVSYSGDSGATWTPVVTDLAFTAGEWRRYAYAIEHEGPIRLRFATQEGNQNKRINLDDIQMSNYARATAVEMPGVEPAAVSLRVFTPDGRYIGSSLPQRPGLYIVREGVKVRKLRVP